MRVEGGGATIFLIFFVCIESLLAWRSHDNLVLHSWCSNSAANPAAKGARHPCTSDCWPGIRKGPGQSVACSVHVLGSESGVQTKVVSVLKIDSLARSGDRYSEAAVEWLACGRRRWASAFPS